MKNEIEGFDINLHEKSSRIVNIDISDEIINKLIFPFNKFDISSNILCIYFIYLIGNTTAHSLLNNNLFPHYNSYRETGTFELFSGASIFLQLGSLAIYFDYGNEIENSTYKIDEEE